MIYVKRIHSYIHNNICNNRSFGEAKQANLLDTGPTVPIELEGYANNTSITHLFYLAIFQC